ncbi:unnamed protein product, partial [marine sediment metagenome]
VCTQYKVKREEDNSRKGVDLSDVEEEIKLRDSAKVVLAESGTHTGIFVGSIVPKIALDESSINRADETISAMKGDDIVLEYYDELHMEGNEPRDVKVKARMLIGQIQDVKVEHRVVDSIDLKARKNLIEAKIFLKLATIFKEVGLINKANEKADLGLERVEEVILESLKASLDRKLVEESFSIKWELLLVQDKLREAMTVCHTLTRLFPDSSLVDRALLKIGVAKMEMDGEGPHEAIGIFNTILRLPKSDLKAEAQFNIGR